MKGEPMSTRPTTVSKVEAALARAGFATDGVRDLKADADEPGRAWYPEAETMMIGKTSVDICERHTEDKVELTTTVTPEQLVRVAGALAETHKSSRHPVRVNVIVGIKTAVAVCDALRGARA